MAVGLLGKGSPLQNQTLTLYTASINIGYTTLDITCVNMSTSNAKISIAITTTPLSIVKKDYIEYQLNMNPGDNYNVSALTISPGEAIVVSSDTAGCIFRVSGVEKI